MKYKILIVEDDGVIAQAIKQHLDSWGYDAMAVDNFREVMKRFISFAPQLVLMDITLPFYNGYHWCSEIRRISTVPILFISSASDNMNMVMAMNMGADDFIAKPFDFTVLVAKVQAVLRRTYDFGQSSELMEHQGVILNTTNDTVTFEGKTQELTKNEYRILQLMFENKGKIVSREAMMTRLWETDNFIDDNTLTVNITRLRKKLAQIGLEDFIRTKKGSGYLC